MIANIETVPNYKRLSSHQIRLFAAFGLVALFQIWSFYSLSRIMTLYSESSYRLLIVKSVIGALVLVDIIYVSIQATIVWSAPDEKKSDFAKAFTFGKFLILLVLICPLYELARKSMPELDMEFAAFRHGITSLFFMPNIAPTNTSPQYYNNRRLGVIIFCLLAVSFMINSGARKIGKEIFIERQGSFDLVSTYDEAKGIEFIKRDNVRDRQPNPIN